jgi:uncharacterized protein YaaW (UPF0174 family)
MMAIANAAAAVTRAIILFPPVMTVLRMITLAFPILASSYRRSSAKIRIRL